MTKDEERARSMLGRIVDVTCVTKDDIAEVLAYTDQIRAEAAERAVEWYTETFRTQRNSMTLALRAAITGKEPPK